MEPPSSLLDQDQILLPEFLEQAPYEKGFSSHYKQKITPILSNVEVSRLEKYASYKKRVALAIPCGLALFIAGIALDITVGRTEDVGFTEVGFFLASSIAVWAYAPVRKYHEEIKSKFLPVICSFYGEMSYSLTGISDVENKYKTEIFPHFNIISTEDFIEGTHKGIGIKLHESHLKIKRRKGSASVFKGLVLIIQFNKAFHGKTLVLKDEGSLGNFFTGDEHKGLTRVHLEDPEFEALFQVFSSDQVEARFLLSTAFMQRLLNLARLRSPKAIPKVQCVFEENTLVISIPCSNNLFEPGSIKRSALQMDDLHTFLAEMNALFELLDVLKLDRR